VCKGGRRSDLAPALSGAVRLLLSHTAPPSDGPLLSPAVNRPAQPRRPQGVGTGERSSRAAFARTGERRATLPHHATRERGRVQCLRSHRDGVDITPLRGKLGRAERFFWFWMKWGRAPRARHTLRGGELGHRLGALGHGVLGELAGQDEAHGGLDLARGDRRLLVVAGQVGGLGGDLKGRWRGEQVSREGGGRHSNVPRAHPCPSHTPSRRCR